MDRQGQAAPLFSENSVLSGTILGPIKQLFEEKERFVIFDSDNGEWEQIYRKGSIQFGNQVIPAKFRARGQGTRLGCAFPPMKINLKTSDTAGTILSGSRALKMLSHCENSAAISARYRRDSALYGIAKVLFPISIDSRLLEIHYIDATGGINETHRAAALEDVKDTAKRLGVKHLDLDPSVYVTPWYEWNTAEASEALVNSIGKEMSIRKYRELEREKPEASKEELSALLRQYFVEHGTGLIAEANNAAALRLPSFEEETKKLQQDYLRRTDKATALRLVLFNIMIGNSDWNHFGLNPMNKHYAMRNVQIFEDSNNSVFPSPYDFDLSRIVLGQVPSTQDFTNELRARWAATTMPLPKYFEGFDQAGEIQSLLAKRQDLINLINQMPLPQEDKEIFTATVGKFFDALKEW